MLVRSLGVYAMCSRSYIRYHDVAIVERRCFDSDQTLIVTNAVGVCDVFPKYQAVDARLGLNLPSCGFEVAHDEIGQTSFYGVPLLENKAGEVSVPCRCYDCLL